MSMIVFRFTIYHILLLVFIFLLFQKFSKSKFLQLVPASSVLISHVELLFGSSIFLGDDYWSIFMILIGLSLIFQLLTFIYQLLIVPKAKTLPSGEFRKTILHVPPLILASLCSNFCNYRTFIYVTSDIYCSWYCRIKYCLPSLLLA